MKRHAYWPSALERVIHKARRRSFRRGTHDCALFVAGCIWAMTGVDFSEPFRGKYRTPEGAEALLKAQGAKTLGDFVTLKLGAPVAVLQAGRGDVVEFMTPSDGLSLGIIDNSGMRIATVAEKGLIFIDKKSATRAWRV